MSNFFSASEHPWEELGNGIKRKIVGYTDDLMAIHVCYDKGAACEPHVHEIHDQIIYVLDGSFQAELCGESRVLKKGDAFVARRHEMHSVVALEKNSVLLDMFSPAREDCI